MKKKHIAIGVGGALGAAVAWKMLTRPSTVNFEDHADSIPHSENSRFIEVDGVELHYQEFGDSNNPTLILIHGYTASTYVWKTVAPLLANEDFHVIAVDLIGYGFSEKPAWFDYTIASQSRMLLRFMNRLGIGKATIVGSSYGGAVSSWFALDYPERVEKLVLVGSVINDDPKKGSPVLKLANLPGVGEVITPFLVDSRVFLKYRMQHAIDSTNHDIITEERIDSVLRPIKSADGHNSLLTTSRNWNANRIEEDAHLINNPTLLIWGDNDTVIPKKTGEKLYDLILNSRLVIFNDCGHIPAEEKPDLFTELVVEFCRDSKGRIEAKQSDDMTLEQVDA